MRRFICLCTALLLIFPAAAQEEDIISRGRFVQLLWQGTGNPPAAEASYSDVNPDSPWAEAVAWAEEVGLVLGDGQGHFFPDEPLTHAHLELILSRYDAFLGRQNSLYLPGAWPDDPVATSDGERAAAQFYQKGIP